MAEGNLDPAHTYTMASLSVNIIDCDIMFGLLPGSCSSQCTPCVAYMVPTNADPRMAKKRGGLFKTLNS